MSATKLTDKQLRFRDEYLVDFNKTRAAIRAGCPPKAAANQGYRMYQLPHVKAAIDERIAQLSINAEETTKLITDIARGNLGDYFTTRKIEFTPKIEIPLAKYIEQLKADIEFEEDVLDYTDQPANERTAQMQLIAHLRARLRREELLLSKNPKAKRIVNGETVLIDQAVLDINKVVADKERGRIQEVTPTEFGYKVKLYAADGALTNIARMHGLFEKDNKQSVNKTTIIDWTGNYIHNNPDAETTGGK